MDLDNVKSEVKRQFKEVSDALFNGTIQFEYLDETTRVSAQASPMFGLNMVKYSESNFSFFFLLQKYLCIKVDILKLKVLLQEFPKLKLKDDLLSVDFVDQIGTLQDAAVPNEALFLEYNFISNAFAFLHECGHLNQGTSEELSAEVNHFSEFNADYFAITKILQYYYTLKTKSLTMYQKKVEDFGNEQNLIRAIVVNSVLIIFLEVLSGREAKDSSTHPDIKKRFCHLILQVIQQLKDNFNSVFKPDALSVFIADIFRTLDFIEREIFEPHQLIFDNLLQFCQNNSAAIQQAMKSDLLDKFNT